MCMCVYLRILHTSHTYERYVCVRFRTSPMIMMMMMIAHDDDDDDDDRAADINARKSGGVFRPPRQMHTHTQYVWVYLPYVYHGTGCRFNIARIRATCSVMRRSRSRSLRAYVYNIRRVCVLLPERYDIIILCSHRER